MAVKSLSCLLDRIKFGLLNHTCPLCNLSPVNRQNQMICPSCEKKILLKQHLPLMVLPNISIYAACGFSYKIKQMIYGLKFGNRLENGSILSEIMIHYWQNMPQTSGKRWIVVPIPSHEKNKTPHVSLIARPFASHFGYKFMDDALIWKQRVRLQHTILNKRKRYENIAGAFSVNPLLIKKLNNGDKILLFDDLITTGATMIEAVSTIQRTCGPQISVCSIAVSHVPLALSRNRLN